MALYTAANNMMVPTTENYIKGPLGAGEYGNRICYGPDGLVYDASLSSYIRKQPILQDEKTGLFRLHGSDSDVEECHLDGFMTIMNKLMMKWIVAHSWYKTTDGVGDESFDSIKSQWHVTMIDDFCDVCFSDDDECYKFWNNETFANFTLCSSCHQIPI